MIGKIISSRDSNKTYEITKAITDGDRPNANIYLCKDENGAEFIAKHFYNGRVSPFVGYGVYNHYGRRRDGSWKVFNEIQAKAKKHDFLIHHYERIHFEGKWIIILEYVKGELLSDFVRINCKSNLEPAKHAIISLVKTLKEWHSHGFAHGDAHLDNAIVTINSGIMKIVLIDYSLIHHVDFEYCKYIGCFDSNWCNRIEEDIRNTSNMGKGFLNELEALEGCLKIGNILSEIFIQHYYDEL